MGQQFSVLDLVSCLCVGLSSATFQISGNVKVLVLKFWNTYGWWILRNNEMQHYGSGKWSFYSKNLLEQFAIAMKSSNIFPKKNISFGSSGCAKKLRIWVMQPSIKETLSILENGSHAVVRLETCRCFRLCSELFFSALYSIDLNCEFLKNKNKNSLIYV